MVMTGTDAELILESLERPEVFGEIFERHFSAVYRFCARRVGGAKAEDLSGETFRRAFEFRRSYDVMQSNALPWLFRIAMNVGFSANRSSIAQDQAYRRFATMASTAPGQDVLGTAEARDELRVIGRLLSTLPEDDVQALLLHVWYGFSYDEVAIVLDVPVGTVRSRLSRLRQRLNVLVVEVHRDRRDTRTILGGI